MDVGELATEAPRLVLPGPSATGARPLGPTDRGPAVEPTDKASEWRRVRVCFGKDVIAEVAKPDPAWCHRYAESMKSRYPWATVTNEALPGAVELP